MSHDKQIRGVEFFHSCSSQRSETSSCSNNTLNLRRQTPERLQDRSSRATKSVRVNHTETVFDDYGSLFLPWNKINKKVTATNRTILTFFLINLELREKKSELCDLNSQLQEKQSHHCEI